MMQEPALHDQLAWLHRELDRQKKKLGIYKERLDEMADIIIGMQTFMNGMKRKNDDGSLIVEQYTFKALPLAKVEENGE